MLDSDGRPIGPGYYSFKTENQFEGKTTKMVQVVVMSGDYHWRYAGETNLYTFSVFKDKQLIKVTV